jgi:hypothetical protein
VSCLAEPSWSGQLTFPPPVFVLHLESLLSYAGACASGFAGRGASRVKWKPCSSSAPPRRTCDAFWVVPPPHFARRVTQPCQAFQGGRCQQRQTHCDAQEGAWQVPHQRLGAKLLHLERAPYPRLRARQDRVMPAQKAWCRAGITLWMCNIVTRQSRCTSTDVPRRRRPRKRTASAPGLGCDRIVASETQAPNPFANLV